MRVVYTKMGLNYVYAQTNPAPVGPSRLFVVAAANGGSVILCVVSCRVRVIFTHTHAPFCFVFVPLFSFFLSFFLSYFESAVGATL